MCCHHSESTVVLWDASGAGSTLKLSIAESVSSLAWLPRSGHLLLVGTTMGWAKMLDTRMDPTQAVLSWLPHPSNRPRKVQGLRPAPFGNFLATYSDAQGDMVKVWDLRMLADATRGGGSAATKIKPSPWLSIVPSNEGGGGMGGGGGGGVVQDVAWSTQQPGLLAVATNSQRGVAFYKTERAQSSGPGEEGGSSTPQVGPCATVPTFVMNTEDYVRSLSWSTTNLLPDLCRPSEEMKNWFFEQRLESTPEWNSSQELAGFLQIVSSSNNAGASTSHRNLISSQKGQKARSGSISATVAGGGKTASKGGGGSRGPRRLVAAMLSSVLDSDVKETSSSVALSGNGFLAHGSSNSVFLRDNNEGLINEASASAASSTEKVTAVESAVNDMLQDIENTMRSRAAAHYGTDVSSNVDLFSAELDAFYRQIQLAWLTSPDAPASLPPEDGANALPPSYMAQALYSRAEIERAVVQVSPVQELFRVWTWLDRLVAEVVYRTSSSLPLQRCGVYNIIHGSGLTGFTASSGEGEDKPRQSPSGAPFYSSPHRAAVLKICGWPGIVEVPARHSSISNRSQTSESNQQPATGLITFSQLNACLDEEQAIACFERICALAVWAGNIEYAVQILQQTIDCYDDLAKTTEAQDGAKQSYSSSTGRVVGAGDSRVSDDQSGKPAASSSSTLNQLDSDDGDDNDEDGHNDGFGDDSSYKSDAILDWDHVITARYVSVLAMVASSLSGFFFVPSVNAQGEEVLRGPGESWVKMCQYVITQLHAVPRVHTHYLTTALYHLLWCIEMNGSDTSTDCKGSSPLYDYFEDQWRMQKRLFHNSPFHTPCAMAKSTNENTTNPYRDHPALLLQAGQQLILYNPWLTLADRLAYAATFLQGDDLRHYVDFMHRYTIREGILEGLLVSGFTTSAGTILQLYLNATSDIQSVALLTVHFLAQHNQFSPSRSHIGNEVSSSSSIVPSNGDASVSSLVKFAERALLDYRTLLNRWRFYVERTHLDIQLNELIVDVYPGMSGKNNGSKQQLSTNFFLSAPFLENQRRGIRLRCSFCSKALPLEEHSFNREYMQSVSHLKGIISFCNNCKNALPRCYICQQHLVSPLLCVCQYIFIAYCLPIISSQEQLSPYVHIRLLSKQNYDNSRVKQDSNPGETSSISSAAKEHPLAQPALAYGHWVLFCQHCRHGGHAQCLMSWFGGSAGLRSTFLSPSDEGGEAFGGPAREVCGVNGCNCQCKLYA
eukprot:scaffold17_cov187-Ochromonas_danica.AAC.12